MIKIDVLFEKKTYLCNLIYRLMYKHFPITLLLFAMLLGWQLQAYAQSVEIHAVVTLNNGQEQYFDLTENDQFSFDGQESLIIHSQGTTMQFSIDDIRKITFDDATDTEEFQTGNPFLYPNPVEKAFAIGNIEDGQMVYIYSIEGRLLQQFQAKANTPIDLSSLPKGMYVVNINEKNLKLIKL